MATGLVGTDGRLRSTTGKAALDFLRERLDQESKRALDTLDDAVDEWLGASISHSGLKDPKLLRQLRRWLLMPNSGIGADPQLLQLVFGSGIQAEGEEPSAPVQLFTIASRSARRVRNLINHRRRCAKVVLDAFDDEPRNTSTNRRARLMQPAQAEPFLTRRLDTLEDLGHFVVEAFDAAIAETRTSDSVSDAMVSNYRIEWLEFVREAAPGMWLSADDAEVLLRRKDFETRLRNSVHSLRATPALGTVIPAALETSSAMSPIERVLAEKMEATTDRPPTSSPAPELALRRGASTTTFVMSAEALTEEAVHDLLPRLSFELLDADDTTEVQVRLVTTPKRTVEIELNTADRAEVQRAWQQALRLLRGA